MLFINNIVIDKLMKNITSPFLWFHIKNVNIDPNSSSGQERPFGSESIAEENSIFLVTIDYS